MRLDHLTTAERKCWVETGFLAENATLSKNTRGRIVQEEECPYRTPYQRDVSRIIYSDAFRRLAYKTQVLKAGSDINARTRLCHTIEVAQISKSICRALALNEDLAEAIALGHDLGHTPFGHAGENALDTLMKEHGIESGFNHNMQSVRVVDKIETRFDNNGEKALGLNLTWETREGIWKHTKINNQYIEDLEPDNPVPSTIEGKVVNFVDSITYLYHDLEDVARNYDYWKLIKRNDIGNIWKKYTGKKQYKWMTLFIDDIVNNCTGKDDIQLTEYKDVYNELKNLQVEKILKSKKIKELDCRGKEIVYGVFEILYQYPDEFLKNNPRNQEKVKVEGLVITLADHIQWYGDVALEERYNRLKTKYNK